MKVTSEVFSRLLSKVFDLGQTNSYELKEQLVEEVFKDFQKEQENTWIILPLEKILNLASGVKIFHEELGEGIITVKNGEKYVQFNSFRMELINNDWPWNRKFQIIS